MTRLALLLLLLARVAAAGNSTTFIWLHDRPMNASTGNTNMVGHANILCASFVPAIGITNATTMAWDITSAAGVPGGAKCSFSIYKDDGSLQIATSGGIACDTAGVKVATGITPFTLAAGQKYQLCGCASTGADPMMLGYRTLTMFNQLSNPLHLQGTNGCNGTTGAAPATIGTISGQTPLTMPIVLVGTNAP